MKEDPRLIVKNTLKRNEFSKSQSQEELFFPTIGTQPHYQTAAGQQVEQRLRKLQGNLKMLEKQYRANLKQGFDHKIKAYRLEAVVERKLIKEALASVKEVKQKEFIQEKIKNSRHNSLLQSRVEVIKRDRERRGHLMKERIKEEKRGYSLCLYETKVENEQSAKKSHDKIVQEAENINVKKDYFQQMRTFEVKKKEEELKSVLLQRIMSNTEKLKELRSTLQTLKEKESRSEDTFLTI